VSTIAKTIQFPTWSAADQLGELRAQKKLLDDQIKELEEGLKACGAPVIEGVKYRVSIVESLRETVDWKKIAYKVGFSNQLKVAHTKYSEVVSVRVSAHKK